MISFRRMRIQLGLLLISALVLSAGSIYLYTTKTSLHYTQIAQFTAKSTWRECGVVHDCKAIHDSLLSHARFDSDPGKLDLVGGVWHRTKRFVRAKSWSKFPFLQRPAIVSRSMLSEHSLGNSLAYYFQTRAYAHAIGADVVFNESGFNFSSFLQFLPRMAIHPEGIFNSSAAIEFAKECPRNYPSLCKSSRLLHFIPQIRTEMQQALRRYLNLHRISFPQDQVVVYYRCGDIISMSSTEYGFLKYNSYLKLIPTTTTSIILLVQPVSSPSRRIDAVHAHKCQALYLDLQQWLQSKFSQAKITVVEENDVSIAMSRMVFAETLICSPSTLCLFAAFANANQAFLPVCDLFMTSTTPLIPHSQIHRVPNAVITTKQIALKRSRTNVQRIKILLRKPLTIF